MLYMTRKNTSMISVHHDMNFALRIIFK